MDVLLLSECQRCGPTDETLARLSMVNGSTVAQVKDRLLYLLDRLEGAEEGEEDEEEEEEEDDDDDDGSDVDE